MPSKEDFFLRGELFKDEQGPWKARVRNVNNVYCPVSDDLSKYIKGKHKTQANNVIKVLFIQTLQTVK